MIDRKVISKTTWMLLAGVLASGFLDLPVAFSNSGRKVKRGDRIIVQIGKFRADGLIVEERQST